MKIEEFKEWFKENADRFEIDNSGFIRTHSFSSQCPLAAMYNEDKERTNLCRGNQDFNKIILELGLPKEDGMLIVNAADNYFPLKDEDKKTIEMRKFMVEAISSKERGS